MKVGKPWQAVPTKRAASDGAAWEIVSDFEPFAGAVVGYNVRFDAYGGSADAGRYHSVGKELAGAVRDGP